MTTTAYELDGRHGLRRLDLAIPSLVAVLVAACSYVTDAALIPDTSLYASGSIGLFPSPIGRTIGVLGEGGLLLVNAAAVGAIVYYVTALAGSVRYAALIPFGPAAFWLIFPGMDALAVALLLAALHTPHVNRRAILLLVAGLTHLALLPAIALVGCVVLPAYLGYSIIVYGGAASVLILALTPYSITASLHPRPLAAAMFSILYGLGPLLLLYRRAMLTPTVLAAAAGVAISVVLVQADDPGTVTRYALPLVPLWLIARSLTSR